jgi:hypothetical protein
MPRGRTIVFIDNSNVFHGQMTAGWRIDVKTLHAFLEREGEVWQAFFFASVTDPPRYQQTNFYRSSRMRCDTRSSCSDWVPKPSTAERATRPDESLSRRGLMSRSPHACLLWQTTEPSILRSWWRPTGTILRPSAPSRATVSGSRSSLGGAPFPQKWKQSLPVQPCTLMTFGPRLSSRWRPTEVPMH